MATVVQPPVFSSMAVGSPKKIKSHCQWPPKQQKKTLPAVALSVRRVSLRAIVEVLAARAAGGVPAARTVEGVLPAAWDFSTFLASFAFCSVLAGFAGASASAFATLSTFSVPSLVFACSRASLAESGLFWESIVLPESVPATSLAPFVTREVAGESWKMLDSDLVDFAGSRPARRGTERGDGCN